MPVTMPPSLRILRRHVDPAYPNVEYLVHFGIHMLDTDPRTNQFLGAPAMIYAGGTVYEIDLHTILSPIAAQIPSIRTLQLTATLFNTGVSPSPVEFYIWNPTTSQTITVSMLPATGTSVPSVVNLSVPFHMDSAAQLAIFWRTGADPTVHTNTGIYLSATLLTFDVDSYWTQTSASIAAGSSTQLIQAPDQATALSESAANPTNLYYWV